MSEDRDSARAGARQALSGGRVEAPPYRLLRWVNLVLLILFPLSWFAPLLRAGLLPLFGMSEISIVTGLQALWQSDVFLALVVTVFALVAPLLKTLGLALIQYGLLDRRTLPAIAVMGKLAMADIFLIALYITLAKGIGVGRVEVDWGLYLFTACILTSLALGLAEQRRVRSVPPSGITES